MSETIDWRKLFILYAVHVAECEGWDFLGKDPGEVGIGEELSEAEQAALRIARTEARELWTTWT